MSGYPSTGAAQPQFRLVSLDALRGIAAFIVVLSHFYLLMPEDARAAFDSMLWAKLLRPFYNGNSAVVIFFALSGYVLSLPYLRGRQLPYSRYVIRRMCRIYVPFGCAMVLSMVLYAAAGHGTSHSASKWFNELWPDTTPSLATLGRHFLMAGTSADMALNPPMWTLVYELRVSLIFPLLVLLCRNTKLALGASIVLLVGSIKLLGVIGQVPHPSYATTLGATLIWTAHIVPYFVIGIVLSRHRAAIRQRFHRMPRLVPPVLFLFVFTVFCIPPGFGSAKDNILYALAAGLVIVLAIENRVLRLLLERRVPQFLGRISYSLYLIHLPIMLALVPILIDRMPFTVMAIIVIAASLIAASAMYVLFESPAIKLGRWLTRVPSSAQPILSNTQSGSA